MGFYVQFFCVFSLHINLKTFYIGLNNIYSDKVHDIHKYNVKIVGSDSKPVAYLDHLLELFILIQVDVARNFQKKDQIKKTIKAMATYKMNKLHLHLSDDEGWRLEIPGIPELTNVSNNS